MNNDQKLDKIVEDIGEIKVTLGKQQVSLDEHIRRTNLIEEDLKPVKKHVWMVNGALKLVGAVITVYEIVSHVGLR